MGSGLQLKPTNHFEHAMIRPVGLQDRPLRPAMLLIPRQNVTDVLLRQPQPIQEHFQVILVHKDAVEMELTKP